MSKNSVSVVLSFRNEEPVLNELIERLHKNLRPLQMDYEMIFVNDASTDHSLSMLMEHAKKDKHLKIINMSRRFGVAPCALAGIKHAKGSAVIYMDADLQDPPEVIPQLVEKWLAGADVVYTTRSTREGESAVKMWVTQCAYRIIRSISEIQLPVDSGDFKLLSRRVVSEILQLKEKDPYLRGLVTWVGFKQEQVFYRREKRFAGNSHFPILGSIQPLKAFIEGVTSFSAVPLYLSFFMGLVLLLIFIFYLITTAVTILLGKEVAGGTLHSMLLLVIGALQLLGIGVIGLYLGKIYNEVRPRPGYIVESTWGFDP